MGRNSTEYKQKNLYDLVRERDEPRHKPTYYKPPQTHTQTLGGGGLSGPRAQLTDKFKLSKQFQDAQSLQRGGRRMIAVVGPLVCDKDDDDVGGCGTRMLDVKVSASSAEEVAEMLKLGEAHLRSNYRQL
eukprot:GHVR01119320.1.p1 GENE.GHVR01119320.1~~GHVR01119320.1.p1  ORF type:complete len:130 (+),score=45.99 GHVR01119320.1:442-831(+)